MGLAAVTRGFHEHRPRLAGVAALGAGLAVLALAVPLTRERVAQAPFAAAQCLLLVVAVATFWVIPSDLTRRMRKNPLSVAGFGLIAAFVAVAILAPILAPPPATSRDPYIIPQEGFASVPTPPRPGHPFGTTEGQYDLYYGIVWGARTAFRVSILVIAIAVAIGLVVGGLSGYYGGRVDEAMMRLTDIFLAFPSLVLAVTVVAVLGRSLTNVMIAIAIVHWPIYARLLRGDILSVRGRDYVEAARAAGAGDVRIIVRHVIPNAIYPFLVLSSLDMGLIVITAAALSFLGLGPDVGYADWGTLINLSRTWILGRPGEPFAYWYVLAYPGAAIFLFVLGWNLLGDAFRDILDPRLRASG
ncbi:MAG: ABC transporter permease [Armatimonadota bacterium]|nr:ABC transporter permease [Armatimonadota bacterium]MDR7422846.1 ABC transporter permease [Armatimonadota bacterium]MDR7455094.1 ABC transporter permease [Armatimonadota bacterium]MDR7497179.1 ABC transporter permease [Armatimonadota bacterium]